MDRAKVGKGERSGCMSAMSACHAEQRKQAEKSLLSLKDLKRKVIETTTELRRVCVRYSGVEGLFVEAADNAQAFLRRLQDGETLRRSNRFDGVLSDLVSGRAGGKTAGLLPLLCQER